jgi:hypothetical protein
MVTTMTELNYVNWDDLQDAYGKASKVPDLLKQVLDDMSAPKDRQSGPWFELWSRLYHQGSVYTASYAAVPILVEAIRNINKPIAMVFFLLPVSIEIARTRVGALRISETLEEDYNRSIKQLGVAAKKILAEEVLDSYLKKAAQAAELVAQGRHAEAAELIDE